jgi:hypothetical protein
MVVVVETAHEHSRIGDRRPADLCNGNLQGVPGLGPVPCFFSWNHPGTIGRFVKNLGMKFAT